ncbi:MAG: MarR family winged helix-turn-helix transcriptional regulator [bacterium]|nr:MarR family winged helix-turn-helix transcriptional regulator [bacterium]
METLESKIISGIERISESIRVGFIRQGLSLALSPTQVRLVNFISQRGPVSQAQIAMELGLDKTTISKSIKSLLKKKIVKIQRDDKDHRLKKVSLIKDINNVYLESVFQALKESIENLNRKERELVYLFIYNTILALFRNGIISYQRMCANCSYGSWKGKKFYCSFLKKFFNVSDFMINCPDFSPK